jgi:hypothetical protein
MVGSKTVEYSGYNKGRDKTRKSFPRVTWIRVEANCHRGVNVRIRTKPVVSTRDGILHGSKRL